MAKSISITTAGIRELNARMKRMEVALEPKDLNPILVDALNLIRDQALENLRAAGVQVLTGNLEKSFITRASKSTRIASAWTKAGTGSKRGSMAPHAHLIEYGHEIVGHKPGKTNTGKRTRAFGFFRRAVDTMRASVRRKVDEGIGKLVWDSMK